jgi:hypothetical protein
MSCQLTAFTPEKNYKVIEHTNTGIVCHWFTYEVEVAELISESKFKCEVVQCKN